MSVYDLIIIITALRHYKEYMTLCNLYSNDKPNLKEVLQDIEKLIAKLEKMFPEVTK